MRLIEAFKIDDSAIPAPDEKVELSLQDLDAGSTGRDESGVMHRFRVRARIKTWNFQYSSMTAEEFQYLEQLLSKNATFSFTYPEPDGTSNTCTAYCSKTSISYKNIRTGMYCNYKFSIIQC